ncbi:MAG: TRAP transporter substrate-binding protein [Lautropia sp.]
MDERTGLRGIGACCLAAGMFLLAGAAPAQTAPIEWRFFTYFAPSEHAVKMNRAFAEEVAKDTGGRLQIRVFAGGELPYKAPDVIRAVATNQVEMGDVAVGFASGDVPELNVLSLPFLCSSYTQFAKALPDVSPLVDQTLAQRFGVTVAMHWTMPPQNLWLNRPVAKIDDLKGLKVRSWNAEQVEMMKRLGGSAVSITSAEVVPALERKVIDGAITSALSANDWRAYDIVKTGYMVNMTMGHQIMMINSAALAKLPADVREVVLKKARDWAPRYVRMAIDGDEAARANLQKNKVTLIEPAAEDVAKARALMRPMWDDWARRYGAVGKGLLDASMKACGAT